MNTNPNNNTLATASDLGTLSKKKTVKAAVSSSDNVDVYKFRAAEPINLSLSVNQLKAPLQVQLLGSDSTLIKKFNQKKAKKGKVFSKTLQDDTYYVRISRKGDSTNYTLRLLGKSSNDPGNTTQNASNLGALPTTFSFKDYVGNDDPNDYFRFNVSDITDFNANLSGLPGRASIYLYQDGNLNGRIDSGEEVTYEYATSDNNIFHILPPGTYYLNISYYDNTQYELSVTSTAYPDYTPAQIAGNSTDTARDLGVLPASLTIKDYVGDLDELDYFAFKVNTVTELNANLAGNPARASLYLYKDYNTNGKIDDGEQVDYFYAESNDNLYWNLTPGNYYLATEYYDSTRYDLTLTTKTFPDYTSTTDPGDRTTTALNIGKLSGNYTAKDYVGYFDESDIYQFTLDQPRNFNAYVTGMDGYRVSAYLYNDANSNGRIDDGERMTYDYAESDIALSRALSAGDYFFSINAYDDALYDVLLQAT